MNIKLTLKQAVNLIYTGGHKRTVLIQGPMGQGKTSTLKTLCELLPQHTGCYFDCTTKEAGDVMVPKIKDLEGNDFVRFATAEELGAHLNTPVIIMIDELGKATASVKNALMRLMLERKIGSHTLHPDSRVFATTNLAAEGLGDILKPHHSNRITTVTLRHMDNVEFLEWAINNDVDPVVMGWAKENPQAFHSFEDYENPADNEYIYHPRAQRTGFVTPRSLEAASDWAKQRPFLDRQTLSAALCGTVGVRAGLDIMAFVDLAGQLPTIEQIKNHPEQAMVPTSVPATCLVVFKVLQIIDSSWVESWFTYLQRLSTEAQGLFVNGVRASDYNTVRQAAVMNCAGFTAWIHQNNHLFSADS